ncbi:recoverin family protein [Planoprotostelium fungivorum]|uniref:Recoverin family protein n=1 Tax=Planoprotostelium fungivorum TaxID=1890364 RepID=A0A2P6NIX8_9EUKA|nr:recoverin family protein [Planoprotostelium fungivorum]
MGNKPAKGSKNADVERIAQETKVDKNEVLKMLETFKAVSDKSGNVDKKTMQAYIQNNVGSTNSALLAAVFNIFDTDNSKQINFQEFVMAINLLSNPTPEEAIDICFRSLDLNGDGYISKGELKEMALLGARMKRHVQIFNAQGSLDNVDLPISEVSRATAEAEQIFNLMDMDKSRSVSREEFTALMEDKIELRKYIEGIVFNENIRNLFKK